MLGLIKKDLLMTKGNLKTIAILFFVFIFVSTNTEGNFLFLPAFLGVITMMSTFSYDEYNKTDAYITTLPNGRKNAVKAKYISTIIMIFIVLLITFTLSIIIGEINDKVQYEETIGNVLGCAVGVFLLQAILYPCIYKFGIEKSRIGIFIGVFGISGIASLLIKNGLMIQIPTDIIVFFNQFWMFIIPLGIIFILFLSYKISTKIYEKKEF